MVSQAVGEFGAAFPHAGHYLMLILNYFGYLIIFLDFIFYDDRLGQNCSHS